MTSVLVKPCGDGTVVLSLAGPDWIEEWLVLEDGRRVLLAHVWLDVR